MTKEGVTRKARCTCRIPEVRKVGAPSNLRLAGSLVKSLTRGGGGEGKEKNAMQ